LLSGINLTLLIGPTIPIPATPDLIESLQSVEVTCTDGARDGFQITFAAGRSGVAGILDYPLINNPLLRPFNRVIIMVTFGVIPKVLIDGIITHQQLGASNDPGKSTFTIMGEDVSVMMDMKEKQATYANLPDMAVVAEIIASYAQYGLVPIIIPPLSIDVPIVTDWVPTQQGTDLAYVQQLAREHDYVFYVEPSDIPGVNTAYWGPSNRLSIPQKALSVNMGAETNVSNINFQYDALKPEFIGGEFTDRDLGVTLPVETFASLQPPLSTMPAWLVNQPNVRKRLFTAGGVNALEAYTKAQAETDASIDAISASGEIDSVVYGDVLRARKLVGLRGAGYSYDGVYLVKSVTHHLGIGKYTQSFTVTREGLGSITPVVPP
jgi:hypothetical protein